MIFVKLTQYEKWSLLIDGLIAIGTIGSVLLSIYFATKHKRIKTKIVMEAKDDFLMFSITNKSKHEKLILKRVLIETDLELIPIEINENIYYGDQFIYNLNLSLLKQGFNKANIYFIDLHGKDHKYKIK